MARETINGISVPIPGTGEPPDFVGDLRRIASDLSASFVPYNKRGQNPLTGWLHLAAYGAVGDGTLHPLSEFFGTLAEAQAEYPDAGVLALDESIDRVAMDQAQADAATDGLTIYCKDGTFIADRAWVCRAGVDVRGSALTGYFPAVNFTDTQDSVGTTWLMAPNATAGPIVTSDPDAPVSPYTASQTWQRSTLSYLRFDGNRKNGNYGPAWYDTANIYFEDCWAVNFENVYTYSAGGSGAHFNNVNVLNTKGLIAYSCNRHDVWYQDSADSEMYGASQLGGSRGSAVVLDNCIGINITGGFAFNAERGTGFLIGAITDSQTEGIRIDGSATSTTNALELDRSPQYWLLVGSEIISFTGFTGATSADRTLTGVTRGVNGTTPAAHADGARIVDYTDAVNAGVALINGTVSCNVTGVRCDQTNGPGLYIDATSEGNTVQIAQYWAGWGAESDSPGVTIEGKHNVVIVGAYKRVPTQKDHQTVAIHFGANARNNTVILAADADYSPRVTYASEQARFSNTVLQGGAADKATFASDSQPLQSGKYVNTGASEETVQLALNTLYYVPVSIASTGTINLMAAALEVVGDGSSVLRFGIYSDDETGGRPGALLAELGTASATSGGGGIGAKTVAGSVSISKPGVYWFALVAQGSSATTPSVRVSRQRRWRVLTDTAARATGYTGSAATGLDQSPCAWAQTSVSGSLPASAGSLTTSRIDPVIAARSA